jgi:hypothetical protein
MLCCHRGCTVVISIVLVRLRNTYDVPAIDINLSVRISTYDISLLIAPEKVSPAYSDVSKSDKTSLTNHDRCH